jgi:hypothetical protein
VSDTHDVRPRGPRLRHLERAADVASNANAAPEKAESLRLAHTSYAGHDGVMALDPDRTRVFDFGNVDAAA